MLGYGRENVSAREVVLLELDSTRGYASEVRGYVRVLGLVFLR